MKGCCSINKKQKITLACFLPVALAALFYAGGYLAQFIYNYQAWTAEGGTPYSGTSPPMPDAAFGVCLHSSCSAFHVEVIVHTNIFLKRLIIYRRCCIMKMVMRNEKIHFHA